MDSRSICTKCYVILLDNNPVIIKSKIILLQQRVKQFFKIQTRICDPSQDQQYQQTIRNRQKMSDQFLDFVRNCSKDSKTRISDFLTQLLNNQTTETSTQQSESQSQHFTKLQKLFNKITSKFSIERSRQISKDERNKKMLTNHEYNYGQMTFKTIFKIFKKIISLKKRLEKEIFYDLGSGSGKVIFGAALCYPFWKCKGIQFLESLYSESLKLRNKILSMKSQIEDVVNEFYDELEEYNLPLIQISHSDFKTDDWSDGTVVFVSSTCYSREVMHEISHMSEKLDKSTILITLTKSLQNPHWKMIDKFEGETSWGACTIYLHRKETESQKQQQKTMKFVDL